MNLPCGCSITPAGEQIVSGCRVGHTPLGEPARKTPRAEKPPPAGASVTDAGRVSGAVPSTPAAARKKKAASSEGQSGKAGRFVMPAQGGMVEPWKKGEKDG